MMNKTVAGGFKEIMVIKNAKGKKKSGYINRRKDEIQEMRQY
jgi:hypothetical protein